MPLADNEIPLPADVQRLLPAGVRLFSFDGEIVYRGRNGNPFDGRIFSLLPVTQDPVLYARRYPQGGQHVQEVYMGIENFHGHVATVFYFYIPDKNTARTGSYRAESFAAMSWSTGQWMWVTSAPCLMSLFEGEMSKAQIGMALGKWMLGGAAKRVATTDGYVQAVDHLVAQLRNDLERTMKQGSGSSRL